MKVTTALLPLAASLAAASAIVKNPLTGNHQIMLHEPGGSNPDSDPRRESVWNNHPGRNGVRNAVESMVEAIGQTLDQAVESVARTGHRTMGQLVGGGRRGRGGNDENRSKRTAWDVIREGHSSRRFAKLLEKHDKIRKRLEDRKEELTVFVPTDEAFRQIESQLDKYSDEFMEKILEYHIVEDEYTAARILGVHTMPTLLQDRNLGHKNQQRLRVSVGLTGVHLNFYSQVVATNIESNNAIIHAIDQLLIPPPRQGNIVEAIPGKFSTFTLAMEATGLADELEKEEQQGGTIFVPTNTAWSKLGQAANSFLFSEKGEPYLRALLEYHIATNETLYSDAFYESDEGRRRRRDDKGRKDRAALDWDDEDDQDDQDDDDSLEYDDMLDSMTNRHNRRGRHGRHGGRSRRGRHGRHGRPQHSLVDAEDREDRERRHRQDDLDSVLEDSFPKSHRRIELPTMAEERTLQVDVSRWMGLIGMIVNGRYRVTVQDGIARDGVVHVVDSVILPPRRGGRRGHEEDEQDNRDLENVPISVEEIKERLKPLVEGGRHHRHSRLRIDL